MCIELSSQKSFINIFLFSLSYTGCLHNYHKRVIESIESWKETFNLVNHHYTQEFQNSKQLCSALRIYTNTVLLSVQVLLRIHTRKQRRNNKQQQQQHTNRWLQVL